MYVDDPLENLEQQVLLPNFVQFMKMIVENVCNDHLSGSHDNDLFSIRDPL